MTQLIPNLENVQAFDFGCFDANCFDTTSPRLGPPVVHSAYIIPASAPPASQLQVSLEIPARLV